MVKVKRALRGLICLAACGVAFVPVAYGQQTSTAALQQRIQELEKRLQELEAKNNGSSPSGGASANDEMAARLEVLEKRLGDLISAASPNPCPCSAPPRPRGG